MPDPPLRGEGGIDREGGPRRSLPGDRASGGAAIPFLLLLLAACRIPVRLEIQTVHVPNLVNGTLDHARGWAAGAGAFLAEFRNDFSEEPERPGSLAGDLIVRDQWPKAGTAASAGEVVSVRVRLATPGKDSGRSNR